MFYCTQKENSKRHMLIVWKSVNKNQKNGSNQKGLIFLIYKAEALCTIRSALHHISGAQML